MVLPLITLRTVRLTEFAMLNLPRRHSLEQQTADLLREQILAATWREWLPGERSLCSMLQVSRHTLRAALNQLRQEGVIKSELGIGNRIVSLAKKLPSKERTSASAPRDVGLLITGPLQNLVATHIHWIDELRAMLAERGARLHLFHGPQFAQRKPGKALQKLLSQQAHSCWILLLSSEAVQRWFQDHQIPCVVAGSLHAEIDLPYCDLDHQAVSRHAAGYLLAKGHRKIALLLPKSRFAGDIKAEIGFLEILHQHANPAVEPIMGYHDATVSGIASTVRRLLQREPAPTALLVINCAHFFTTLSVLARLGRRVPEDLSIISRDYDHYFSALLPVPAHYLVPAHSFAKKLLAALLNLLSGGPVVKRVSHLMPDFIPGQSVTSLPHQLAKVPAV